MRVAIQRTLSQHVGTVWEDLARESVPRLRCFDQSWKPASPWWGRGTDRRPMEIDIVVESESGNVRCCWARRNGPRSRMPPVPRAVKGEGAQLPSGQGARGELRPVAQERGHEDAAHQGVRTRAGPARAQVRCPTTPSIPRLSSASDICRASKRTDSASQAWILGLPMNDKITCSRCGRDNAAGASICSSCRMPQSAGGGQA